MAASPQFKVYRNGEYVASCKYAEDAAALVANGGSVKWHHKHVIWADTEENRCIAGDSYDRAAHIMLAKIQEINERSYIELYGKLPTAH